MQRETRKNLRKRIRTTHALDASLEKLRKNQSLLLNVANISENTQKALNVNAMPYVGNQKLAPSRHNMFRVTNKFGDDTLSPRSGSPQ
jgi:acetolactate synthase small subunit